MLLTLIQHCEMKIKCWNAITNFIWPLRTRSAGNTSLKSSTIPFSSRRCQLFMVGPITKLLVHLLILTSTPGTSHLVTKIKQFSIQAFNSWSILNLNAAKKLAEYLHFLDHNDAEYRRYFDWRYQPSSDSEKPPPLTGFCGVCTNVMLNDIKLSSTAISKSYEDIHSWWFKEANCQSSISPFDEDLSTH